MKGETMSQPGATNEETKIDPRHQSPRTFLRVVGPILLLLGLILIVVGAIQMFSPAWSHHGGFMPGEPFGQTGDHWHGEFEDNARTSFGGFGMVAAGMLCLFVGGAMTGYGYMGRVARYAAAEMAPVGKDAINYMAGGVKGSVRDLAAAVGDGLRGDAGSAAGTTAARCPTCNAENADDANFCSQCGAAMLKSRACPSCGERNDGDARFCDHCGKELL
jgi:hypothetical protein